MDKILLSAEVWERATSIKACCWKFHWLSD